MLDYEYRRKLHKESKRSWTVTIITASLAIAGIVGIAAAWRYMGHDIFTVMTVIVPASLVVIFLILVAINGRRRALADLFAGILELIFWWP